MKTLKMTASIVATIALALVVACDRKDPTAPPAQQAVGLQSMQASTRKVVSVTLCSPNGGGFTLASTNPYWPLTVGRQLILNGEEEGASHTLQITVLNQTRAISGVTTRVVEEREFANGELIEVSFNYFAQAPGGAICYFGEDVDIYEEAGISHEGTWCADHPDFAPGIFIPAEPTPGTKFQIEVAPGVAEDEGKIVGVGPVEVPFGLFTNTIRIREFNPLDRGKDYKVHAAGTGIIIDGTLQLEDVNQTSGAAPQPTITGQTCGVS
jgi:hypothetical protein